MKKTILKTVLAALCASVAAYFGTLAVPLLVLLCVMLTDYATGMVKAYMTAQLSSRTGLRGILKKLCYMAMVAVGAAVDYLLTDILCAAGIRIELRMYCGLIIAVWLIVNELISILENLAVIGVPGFPALNRLLLRLRTAIEKEAEPEDSQKTRDD
ncbi:MAG: holin family protein [Hominenteromicrobium sp.]